MVPLGTLISPAKTVRCGDDSYPVLSMTMHNGLVFQDDKFKKEIASKDKSDYKVVYRNQLVISFPIDEGVLAAQRIADAGIVSPAYGIWDIDQSQILPEFLEKALRCERAIAYYKAKLRGSTARRRSLPTPTLLEFTVPLPSLETQEAILGLANKVKLVIDKREQQLQRLNDLIKARFVEQFGDPMLNSMGWKTKRFDTICENLDSKRKPITASEREAGAYPYYGASGIVDYVADYLFDEDILLVSEDGANLLMRSTPIAFSVSGKVWVNNHAHVVRFKDMGLQKYIEVYFSMIDISDQITGSAQPKLNQAKLNAMMIPTPNKEETDSFWGFLQQVDKSKVVIQKALDRTQMLLDGLMQCYFG